MTSEVVCEVSEPDREHLRSIFVNEAESLRKKYHLSVAEVKKILLEILANSV